MMSAYGARGRQVGSAEQVAQFDREAKLMAGPRHLIGASLALAFHLAVLPVAAAEETQEHFRSPLAAVDAALEAVRADDGDTLAAIFGPDSGAVLSSGDEVADRDARERFLEAADVRASIARETEDRALLSVGEDDWPFPIPLRQGDAGWYFDTPAGAEELINRRIGRNELHAIAALQAFVEAQYEYYTLNPQAAEPPEFAQRLASSEGKRDGLYWPVGDDEVESPMGPLVAKAVAEGYGKGGDQEGPSPFHGYLFRLLKAQGPHAPGGAKSYLQDGRLTGGFALVAYPAEYGNSGVMSFMVNQRDIIFQKDLGEDTRAVAEALEAYDPDNSWEAVDVSDS